MRQCVAGGKESNFSMVAGLEAKDECRSAMDALKQSPLYNCRCKRGMKKEKNCLRIYWGIYQTLQGNDFLEDSPYEPVNSRLSDIFRLAPIIEGGEPWSSSATSAPGRGGAQGRVSQGREPTLGRASPSSTELQDPSRNRRAHPNWAILVSFELLTSDVYQRSSACEVRSSSGLQWSLGDKRRGGKCSGSEPAVARENNCLNAAKACNLNDTCKKYRSAYISPCTSRVSTAEVPPKHSYGMLFCSCPLSDQTACFERRRQTIVPVCSYEEKQTPNCLELQASCKTNYICRSRLADFFVNCQPEPRSLSGCLKENYADCLLAYSGLIGTVMTPNYLRSPKISVSPYCDCSNSGNNKDECDKFTEVFHGEHLPPKYPQLGQQELGNAAMSLLEESIRGRGQVTDWKNTRHQSSFAVVNICRMEVVSAAAGNAIQAFGNGTDVGVWQPMSPVQTTTSTTTPYQRNRERNPNTIDNSINTDPGIYHFCGSLQAQKLKSNSTVDGVFCVDPQIDGPSTSNAILRNAAVSRWRAGLASLLPPLLWLCYCSLLPLSSPGVL
ncbi:hypothetical protein L3Q82_012095 [Scortum barcoo]|uniref:Uncharacterized protein n=1 Tax=Scortum barcoo TaxID=214431 RepID=A0ACB8W7S6_9TELE|nr:hypothetical protein L3Q82_012095 [Scortum barcoo]